MIFISFGMLKSASTMLYQLTEEIFRAAGRRPVTLGRPFKPLLSVENYFDVIDELLLARIADATAGRDIVLKTHQRPSPAVAEMIAQRRITASIAIRDPREIALSMVDHGERSRRANRPEFAECIYVQDCLPSLDHQIASVQAWQALPGVPVFRYADICTRTDRVVDELARRIGVEVDAGQIAHLFHQGRGVGQFNKGVMDRFHEMAPATSTLFLDRYGDFYHSFGLPMREPSPTLLPEIKSSRIFHQTATRLRRLARSRLG